MATTALPSVAFWLGRAPISEELYDFPARGGMPYFLANPHLYDRIMIAVGSFTDPFCIDDLAEYRTRWGTRAALVRLIESLNAIGKRPIMYIGGWHDRNAAAWRVAAETFRLESKLADLLSIFPRRPKFECDFAFDATSGGYVLEDIQTRAFGAIKAAGAECYTESRATARSLLATCPSVTMAATAASWLRIRSDEPERHAVLITNKWYIGDPTARDPRQPDRVDVQQNLVPGWRREGRPVFIPAEKFGRDGTLPAYWDATNADPIRSDPAPSPASA